MFFSINTGGMGDGMVVTDMGGNSIESLPCEAGEEFSDYIREHLSPFPPCNPMLPGSSKDRTTLWPGRRVEFQVEKGKKQTAKVVQWEEYVTGFGCFETMLTLTLEKEDGSHVVVNVSHVDIDKGGEVHLRNGARSGISDKLTWLDPPTTPDYDSDDEEDEE